MKSHSGVFTSVCLCGKGEPQGFYLTLTYAKMQRAVLFAFSPFCFWLRKELWLFAEHIHTEGSSIAECMHTEGSSSISDAIWSQMQKLDISRPYLHMHLDIDHTCLQLLCQLLPDLMIDGISNLCVEASSNSVMESKHVSPLFCFSGINRDQK